MPGDIRVSVSPIVSSLSGWDPFIPDDRIGYLPVHVGQTGLNSSAFSTGWSPPHRMQLTCTIFDWWSTKSPPSLFLMLASFLQGAVRMTGSPRGWGEDRGEWLAPIAAPRVGL